MKAIRVFEFGKPEVMRLEDVAEPEPGPGEVVVAVRAAGVNPVDTYFRSGQYRPDLPLPYTPGFDGAGVIEKIGEGVKHRKVGERVYIGRTVTGTYASKALCREFQTHPLPEGISFAQGAAIGIPYGAAYRSLFQRAKAQAGEIVLVHGASGGVGLAAVQLACAAGLRVIGTAGSPRGLALVTEQGADAVLNHREDGYLERLADLTCGVGINIILEMLANVNLAKDLRVLAIGGRVVIIGSRGTIEIDPREIMGKESEVLGMILFNSTDEEYRIMHAAFGAGLRLGTIRPVVSMELPLEQAAEAHHAVMEQSTFGKIVLIP